jgi:hypothetical protein
LLSGLHVCIKYGTGNAADRLLKKLSLRRAGVIVKICAVATIP